MANTIKDTIATRKVAILAADESSPASIQHFIAAIAAHRFWDRPRKNRMQSEADETRGRTPSSA